VVQFPAVEKVVGGRRLKDYDQDPGETLQAPYNKVPGAIAMLGANTVTALEF